MVSYNSYLGIQLTFAVVMKPPILSRAIALGEEKSNGEAIIAAADKVFV